MEKKLNKKKSVGFWELRIKQKVTKILHLSDVKEDYGENTMTLS